MDGNKPKKPKISVSQLAMWTQKIGVLTQYLTELKKEMRAAGEPYLVNDPMNTAIELLTNETLKMQTALEMVGQNSRNQ